MFVGCYGNIAYAAPNIPALYGCTLTGQLIFNAAGSIYSSGATQLDFPAGRVTTLYLNMSAGAQIIAAGALGLYASADTTTIKMARGTFQNRSFTTAGRPAATGIAGACYWDTTLNALGVSDGTTWHIIPGYIATGTAVLVAGTNAVVNAAITAASKIKVYVLTPGGTVGAPFVSVVAAGTGFTISSTSSSDTSTIQYEIESY
jgi:hypothetical protein